MALWDGLQPLKNKQNIAGSTIISYYVKVSGVRKGRAVWPNVQVTNQPTSNQPDKKSTIHNLANAKLSTNFTGPERSLKQPANCKPKTANYLKKMQEPIRLWREVL